MKLLELTTNVLAEVVNMDLVNIDGIFKFDDSCLIPSWSLARVPPYNSDFITPEIVNSPFLNSPADIGVSRDGVMAVSMGNNVVYLRLSAIAGLGDEPFRANRF